MEKPSRPVAVAVALGVVTALGAGSWALLGDRAPQSAPYVDERSAGRLTLCNADGEQVGQGSVSASPFTATVVGSTELPVGVSATGAVGTVFVHQPRAGVGSEEFSGTPLSATVPLRDRARPSVGIDEGTWSLEDFTTAFPAEHDGFVQLRLVLGTPENGTLTEAEYDSLDLRVDGDTWRAIDPGDAQCPTAQP